MAEYIVYESESVEATDYLGAKHRVYHYERREEIVRCKDCKHHKELIGGVCEMWGFLVGSQGFCSWGERRGE